MSDKVLFLPIQKIDSTDGRRLVFVRTTDGKAIDNQDEILDYTSSKPHIQAWSDDMARRSSGVNKGNVRTMHPKTGDRIAAGHLADIQFDDALEVIDGWIKVSDDNDWQKVLDKTYTGVSWGGSTVGAPWIDKALTKQHGRTIRRYTLKPNELSLVDRPRVPGADILDILKADIPTEGNSMEEKKEAVQTDLPLPEAGSQPVAKGMWQVGRFAEIVASVDSLHQSLTSERKYEGDETAVPEDVKKTLAVLGTALVDYTREQVAEIVAEPEVNGLVIGDEEDIDAMLAGDEIEECDMAKGDFEGAILKGDFPGHPFRGNQHAGGAGEGSSQNKASTKAHAASIRAAHSNTSEHHAKAAAYHAKAQAMHEKAGNKKTAAFHGMMAKNHTSAAKFNAKSEAKEKGDLPVTHDWPALSAQVARLTESVAALSAEKVAKGDFAPVAKKDPPVLMVVSKVDDTGSQPIAKGDTPLERATAMAKAGIDPTIAIIKSSFAT